MIDNLTLDIGNLVVREPNQACHIELLMSMNVGLREKSPCGKFFCVIVAHPQHHSGAEGTHYEFL